MSSLSSEAESLVADEAINWMDRWIWWMWLIIHRIIPGTHLKAIRRITGITRRRRNRGRGLGRVQMQVQVGMWVPVGRSIGPWSGMGLAWNTGMRTEENRENRENWAVCECPLPTARVCAGLRRVRGTRTGYWVLEKVRAGGHWRAMTS